MRPDGVAIARGVVRMLAQHDRPALTEVTLRNSRRADVMAIGRDGTVWIVEVKSSVPDYRSDAKWQEYRDFCDRFFFAVPPDFPAEIIPDDCGLIIADTYDGAIVREAPDLRLNAARRKAVTLRFARMAAERLTRLNLEMSAV
ncbi:MULTISPECIES: MmcB family DNA repair protein [unclassified Minwuia]|uniref:MmcB family DNA repair protein n=1 Tax=unclassified Minwuia TaxID=2618799 RepID=UPI00247A6461|nr:MULTISPECIES: MmcB family DNA repair protein [unclassified Minwuia]